jgi:glycosyltransferase involved in cell wall biosynthesis
VAIPSLTILVPTHDRAPVLARVWHTWLAQSGIVQVVIVDDGSRMDYASVFAELRAACEARAIELVVVRLEQRVGAPAARNAGLVRCTGDEILTTDDDILLGEGMVEACRRQRPESAGPVIVGSRVIYLRDDESHEAADARSRCDPRAYFRREDLTLVPWVDPGRPIDVPFVTAIALWPRVLFDRGLRYCEAYGGNGFREETDPQIAAQTGFGARVVLANEARAFHLPLSLAYAQGGGQRRHGRMWFEAWALRNNLRFVRRHARYLRERIARPPLACAASLAWSRLGWPRWRGLLERRA